METVVDVQQLQQAYRGKKVFLTGHTGFKGAWLMAILHQWGATVKGYALPPAYANGLYSLLRPGQPGEEVLADIRDKALLEKTILEFSPDYIFHLAAQPLVRRSYEIPAETFGVNVVGTANLLEAVTRLANPCSIVVITTDKVYENKEEGTLFREIDRLGGYDPYSASKACTELVVSSFRNSFFNLKDWNKHQKALVAARAGNVIGGGDWSKDRIIPDIVRSLQEGKSIDVRNPAAVRPWQHVLEPLAGYLQLGAAIAKDPHGYSGAYNFGPLPGDHLTVQQVVEQAIANWGKGAWKDVSDPQQPHEAGLLQLDVRLAMQELEWQPRLSAAEAIRWTIDWYKQPVSQQAGFAYEQLSNYFGI